MSFSQTVIAGKGIIVPFTAENFKKILDVYNKRYDKNLVIEAPEGELDFGQIDFWDALELSQQMKFNEVQVHLYHAEGESKTPIVIMEKDYFVVDERLETCTPKTEDFEVSEELVEWGQVFEVEPGLVFFSEVI